MEHAGPDTAPKVDRVIQKIEKKLDEMVDDNFLQYCSLDNKGEKPLSKKSLGEKEQEFLDALRVCVCRVN